MYPFSLNSVLNGPHVDDKRLMVIDRYVTSDEISYRGLFFSKGKENLMKEAFDEMVDWFSGLNFTGDEKILFETGFSLKLSKCVYNVETIMLPKYKLIIWSGLKDGVGTRFLKPPYIRIELEDNVVSIAQLVCFLAQVYFLIVFLLHFWNQNFRLDEKKFFVEITNIFKISDLSENDRDASWKAINTFEVDPLTMSISSDVKNVKDLVWNVLK